MLTSYDRVIGEEEEEEEEEKKKQKKQKVLANGREKESTRRVEREIGKDEMDLGSD